MNVNFSIRNSTCLTDVGTIPNQNGLAGTKFPVQNLADDEFLISAIFSPDKSLSISYKTWEIQKVIQLRILSFLGISAKDLPSRKTISVRKEHRPLSAPLWDAFSFMRGVHDFQMSGAVSVSRKKASFQDSKR